MNQVAMGYLEACSAHAQPEDKHISLVEPLVRFSV